MIGMTMELLKNDKIQMFLKKCPERFNEVLQQSINKANAAIKTYVKKDVPKQWNIPKEEMADFRLKNANLQVGVMTASAELRGERIGLMKLKPFPSTQMIGKTQGGVSFSLLNKTRNEPRAFVGKGKHGGEAIFRIKRDATGNYIKGSYGPKWEHLSASASPVMTTSEKTKISEKAMEHAQKQFDKTFMAQSESWLRLMGLK